MRETNEKFEALIKQDTSLSSLLEKQQVTAFSNFTKNEYDDDFKAYIEEDYSRIFNEIIEKTSMEKINSR